MTRWTIELDDDVARRVTEAAAERGVAPEQLAGEAVAEQFGGRRRLAFAAIGASGSPRGAAQADDLLAEGFGQA
jgi:predicted transcriptional regulator